MSGWKRRDVQRGSTHSGAGRSMKHSNMVPLFRSGVTLYFVVSSRRRGGLPHHLVNRHLHLNNRHRPSTGVACPNPVKT
jgi:hypothetical protein